jgi:signal peptidase II
VVVADQWSKAVVTHPFGGRTTGAVLPIRNPGLLSGVGAGGRFAVGTVAVAMVIGFGAVIINRVRQGRLAAWAAGLLLGGAVANLVDRVALGCVRDFLVVGRMVVNLADIAILIGIAAYMWWAAVARVAKTSPSRS